MWIAPMSRADRIKEGIGWLEVVFAGNLRKIQFFGALI